MARLTAFSRVLLRTVGPPALRRLAPVYCGLAVLVAILFGPTGMSAAGLVADMHASAPLRLGLWLAWLILVVAAVRPLFHSRDALYLRAAPVRPIVHESLLGALALAMQLPWTWLWWRGDGALAAVATTLTAAAVCCVAAIAPRGWVERVVVAATVIGLLAAVAVGLPHWQQAAVAGVVLVAGVRAAWRRAPEHSGVIDVSALLANRAGLALAHAAAVMRRRSSSLARGLVIVAIGGALTGLIARNNDIAGAAAVAVLAMSLASIVLTPAVAMIAGPVMESERSLRWLLDANGVGWGRRMVASATVCGAGGVVYSLVFAGLVSWIAPLDPLPAARVFAEVVVLGLSAGLILLRCARWAERADGIDGTRLVSAAIGVATAAAIAVAVLDEWALLALAAVALKLSAGSDPVITPVVERGAR